MPPWSIGLLASLLFLSVLFNLVAVKVIRLRDRDYDRLLTTNDHLDARVHDLSTALETIRDMGPTGPDPLPPCQFCGQGTGHWISPGDKMCPAVFARSTLISEKKRENLPLG